MKHIIGNVYVGEDEDAELILKSTNDEWAIVHACKEKWHRELLGYTGRGAPKDHPEYLFAERGNRLYMNIVDAPKSIFFDKGMIDKALDFIHEKRNQGLKVLVHCNEGMSRSPSLALIYMVKHNLIKGDTLEDVEAEFMKLYPKYNPGTGMREFVKENWSYYWRPF